jgi:uncharacterized protein
VAQSAAHATLFGGKARVGKRRRRVVVALLLAWLIVNAAFAYVLLHPRRAAPFLRFEEPRYDAPDRKETALQLVAEDGVVLRGIAMEPPNPKGVVLVLHGYGGSRLNGVARRVAGWGYAAIAIDFRAHGESEGTTTTFGLVEARDVRAATAEARARWPSLKIAGWGLSMGGAALLYAPDVARDFDALVLESVYADIDSAYRRRIETFLPSFLYFLAWPGKLMTEVFGGLDSEAMRPSRAISAFDGSRLLLTTGEFDPWATTDDLRLLAEGAPGATTRVVKGASHHDVLMKGGDEHFDAIRAFLDARLK